MKKIGIAACLALVLVSLGCSVGEKGNPLTQTSSEGPVTVAVTPKQLAASADTWEFEIALNTHSVELDHDLTQISTLTGSDGQSYGPGVWQGDGPSGHHRSGVLRFQVPATAPEAVDLTIRGVGGVAERRFRWSVQP